MQRWVWQQGWTSLHDAQERAIGPILDGRVDVIISAATAAGKTEAAFLPICSALATARDSPSPAPTDPWAAHDPWADPVARTSTGVEVLYLSPLKALINDQFDRLERLCETADIKVHRWHGDVSGTAKAKVLKDPHGVLLITPESLEALFVNRGIQIPALFAGLRYVVIDELHSFLATPRGAQLQSLLGRVELAIRRRPPRVGLSATLGDMGDAAAFLRPTAPESVEVIVSESDGREVKLQVRGYRAVDPQLSTKEATAAEKAGQLVEVEEITDGDQLAIAEHLFATLRGKDNLVFANARRDVELYADLLARRCEADRLPNEFWPHHGSLSKDMREDVEAALKDSTRPVTAVCTSTLEMGIDIGSIDSVAQIDPPPSVASLRQRLGRSGRRDDDPRVIRLYITENDLDGRSSPVDELRCDLVQTVAMVRLMLAGWVEAPADPGLNLSTLIQQVLSTIAQHGGAKAAELHNALCGPGPFVDVDTKRFARLLRAMAAKDLVVQAADGTLLHGQDGDRAVNHYSFYAAFASVQEWRLVANGKPLGTIPIDHPIYEGAFLIFSGRRWRITTIDAKARVIELTRAAGGKPPVFGGEGASVTDRVRAEMVQVYRDDQTPPWLNVEATRLVAEGREAWRRLDLDRVRVLAAGEDTLVLPWVGDRAITTASLALATVGVEAAKDGPILRAVECSVEQLRAAARTLLDGERPDPLEIARQLENTEIDKWDYVLDADLAAEATVARLLDLEGAWTILREIVDGAAAQPVAAAASPTASRRSRLPFDDLLFCVLDVETTGFSPRLGDRVVEIATTLIRGNGDVVDEWSTLVNPQRDIGATHVHGIAAGDVLDAPPFDEVAGDLLERLDGAVLTAHNARFDCDFVNAEYERAGLPLPPIPTLCTLGLVTRLDPGIVSRKLSACCARIGHPIPHAHAALHDTRAAAALLLAYLPIAVRAGATTLEQLGCSPLEWPTAWPTASPAGRTHARGSGELRLELQADYLAHLVSRLDGIGVSDPDIAAYHDVLDRALEDRRITEIEAQVLNDTAASWGLSTTQVNEAHRTYLDSLAAAALADGILTELERADIELVARLLGTDLPDLTSITARDQMPESASLAGKSVCFTGALLGTIAGRPITRDDAHRLASAAGLTIKTNVSRGLDLLVVADPDSQSGKATKARQLGTRVIAEAVFWRTVGADVQ
jgi:ATP-dependent Lhr-like helicase